MGETALRPTLLDAARNLARANAASEPEIERIYLFHDSHQIRLVAVDPTTVPSEQISPYYFDPDSDGGVPYSCAIALISPEEEAKHIPPPPDWGDWNQATVIWPEN